MKLFIPPLGTLLRLNSKWNFTLQNECRNFSVIEALFGSEHHDYGHRFQASLPEETVLKVDRIFLRLGAKEYDSITFLIKYCPDPRLRSKSQGGHGAATPKTRFRFWASLGEVNGLECEVLEGD